MKHYLTYSSDGLETKCYCDGENHHIEYVDSFNDLPPELKDPYPIKLNGKCDGSCKSKSLKAVIEGIKPTWGPNLSWDPARGLGTGEELCEPAFKWYTKRSGTGETWKVLGVGELTYSEEHSREIIQLVTKRTITLNRDDGTIVEIDV